MHPLFVRASSALLLLLVAARSVLADASTTPNFSVATSQVFVRYAAAAVCTVSKLDDSEIRDWTCQECQYLPGFQVTTLVHNQVSGVLAYAGHTSQNKTIVISFRGSANAQNAVEDFLYPYSDPLVVYPYDKTGASKVEYGFYEAYLSVQPEILAAIQYYNNNSTFSDYQVWVTGHSLGAALSIHGAVDVQQDSKQAKTNGLTVYNYGCPRVGNTAFAEFYHSLVPNTYLQVNNSDPVPRLPPRAIQQPSGFGLPIYDYTRNSWEVWYEQRGNTRVLHDQCTNLVSGQGEDLSCSDSDSSSLGVGLPNAVSANDHLVCQFHSMLCGQLPGEVVTLVDGVPNVPSSLLPNP